MNDTTDIDGGDNTIPAFFMPSARFLDIRLNFSFASYFFATASIKNRWYLSNAMQKQCQVNEKQLGIIAMKTRIPVNEYAMQKQLNPSTVYRWIQQGKIETEKNDGLLHVVVDIDEIALNNAPDRESLIAQMHSEIEYLREENQQLRDDRQRTDQIIQQMQQDAAEAQQRSDTLVLQFTRHFEEQTKLLEDMRQREEKKSKGSFFSRLLRGRTEWKTTKGG